MPFLAEEHISIPSQDLLSWMFDNQTYNQDAPVSDQMHRPLQWLTAPDIRRRGEPGTYDKLKPSTQNYQNALRGLQINWPEEGRLCLYAFVQ